MLPAHEASPAQRRRSGALVALMLSLTTVGALARAPSSGRAPDVCPRPGVAGGVLVCDGTGAPAGARAWLAGGKLDLNAAKARELEAIAGIGPVVARAVLEERARRGRFTSVQELDAIDGIGEKTLEKLIEVVEVVR